MTSKIKLAQNDCECDTRPGQYYVSVYDDAGTGKLGLLLGPFSTHRQALDMVDKAKQKAMEVNDRAFWYAYGTVRMPDDYKKPGILNDLIRA